MRSLYSGVTGIRSHQVRMDVIGNNIANVNTVGFKGSRVSFTDVMSQTMSAGSQMSNPMQIGLGVGVGSTDLIQDDGAFQMTGRSLDLAIQGNGLFVLKGPEGILYTRAGSFDWNTDGYLFNPANGMRVQGWMADPATGQIGRTDMGTLTDIRMLRGDVSLASASTEASMRGNLDAAAADGTKFETAFTAYDSLGRPIPITLQYTKTATGWDWGFASKYTPLSDPTDPTSEPAWESATGGPTSLTFTTSGKLVFDPTDPTTYTGQITVTDPDGAAADLVLDIDFRSITQAFATSTEATSGSNSTVQIDKIDGTKMGILDSVFIDESGVVSGRFTNGTTRVLAQIALASFNNMAGLTKVGGSTFAESPASGTAQVGRPNSAGRGGLVPGNLEGSNVDLAAEFTNMIMTQRGFQANTKMVTTADDMLQELINLRR